MYKRKQMNLQMFAEDPAPAQETAQNTADSNTADSAEKQNETPEPKPKEQNNQSKEQNHSDELEELKKEIARLKADAARNALRDTTIGLLRDEHIEATPDVLELVMGENEEDTKAKIKKLSQYVESRVKAAEKERATGHTPRSYGGQSGNSTKTVFQQKIDKYKSQKGR